nr:MAG TPA: hypothetical protein [Caudoviricetes sp.]
MLAKSSSVAKFKMKLLVVDRLFIYNFLTLFFSSHFLFALALASVILAI